MKRRAGFTLVEMLVSVAIVMLMMVLFAEIFQIATGMMVQQKGIAENDQRARTLETIIRKDLELRTFRKVVPFYPDEAPFDGDDFDQRKGYLYISENDPNSDADDVIQFTVDGNAARGMERQLFYGRASVLTSDMDGDGTLESDFVRNTSQPEFDDGHIQPNGTASSPYAQIAYFLRDGNLYRRVVLIREPHLPAEDSTSESDALQPKLDAVPDGSGGWIPPSASGGSLGFFDPASAASNPPASAAAIYPNPVLVPQYQSGNFWTDFDFSVVSGMDFASGTNSGVRFQGALDLSNRPAGPGAIPFGVPSHRWGWNHGVGELPDDRARPREYVDHYGTDGVPGTGDDVPHSYFIGRFNHEETSHPGFHYPQTPSIHNGGNPFRLSSSVNPLAANIDGTVQRYMSGERRSEDLIMPQVHAFDVKVWDSALRGYYDIGHGTPGGDFYVGALADFQRALHGPYDYGPQPPTLRDGNPNPRINRVYDTWHPDVDIASIAGAPDPPPYMPLKHRPPNPSAPSVSDPYWKGQWQANTDYIVGDLVLSSGDPLYTQRMIYRCIQSDDGAGNSGNSGVDSPIWSQTDGATIQDGEGGETLVWQAVYNFEPLRTIQIRVLMYDNTSNQMKQATFVVPMEYSQR